MDELMLFSALSAQRTEAALLRGNAVTERFGLTLTPEQCGRLLERRAEALRETERIEPGEGILPKLAVALCDSPCVGPENWEEALGGLTERSTTSRARAANVSATTSCSPRWCGYTTAGQVAARTASPISMAARCCALRAREGWGTMANELTSPLTDAEEGLWQEKLAALLVRQIALYTANESSSVPAAAARELLRGVLFFLAVPEEPEASSQPEDVRSRYEAERADRIRVLLPLDLADELARGQHRAQRDSALTLALWRKVVAALPPLENRSLRDTLRSIGRGFRRYDTRFFPQRFDCDIDYQLAVSVSESLLGINYVNQYLTRLAAENSLLTRLPQGEVRAVLERSCPDWRGLLVNLYAPVAANALARTLLGGEGLTLSDGEIGALRERWEHAWPEQIMADLLAAADALAERLALPRGAGKYLSGFAREVAARAEALRDCGGLRGLFV